MTNEENGKALGKLIAKTWADGAFKARLLADPAGVLTAEGLQIPAGVSVKVVENTDTVFNLVLPSKPADLSDADMDAFSAGGRTYYTTCGGGMCL
jgi:hypothetical protein